MVMLFDADTVGNLDRLCFRKQRCSGIAFFLRIVPVLMISRQFKIMLPFLEFRLL